MDNICLLSHYSFAVTLLSTVHYSQLTIQSSPIKSSSFMFILILQNNHINYNSFGNSDGSNANAVMTNPWSFGMNLSTSRFAVNPIPNRQSQIINYETTKKFIPSPELIVDSSQSSESNEKFIINHHHHRHVAPVSLVVVFKLYGE